MNGTPADVSAAPGALARRLNLTGAAVLAIVCLLLVLTSLLLFDSARTESEGRLQELQTLALAARLSPPFDADRIDDLRTEAEVHRPRGSRIVLRGAANEVVIAIPAEAASLSLPERSLAAPLSSSRPESLIVRIRDGGRSRVTSVRIGPTDAPAGVLQVVCPAPWFAPTWRSALIALVVGFVVYVSGLWWLMRRVRRIWSAPLDRIMHTARALARGEPAPGGDDDEADELGLLARALRRMAGRMNSHLRQLEHQRASLRSLLAELRDGVVVAERDGRIALLNTAAAQLLQLDASGGLAAVQGTAVERHIHEHDVQRLLCASMEELASDTLAGEFDAVIEAQSPAGPAGVRDARVVVEGPAGQRHLLAQACDIAWFQDGDSDEPQTARLLVLSDITTLTRSLQMRTDFVSNASHELRTPLATIRAAVEMLAQSELGQKDESARQWIAVIERQSARLEALARDLLDLAKLEDPGKRFEPRALPLSDLERDLQAHFAEVLERRGLRLEADFSAAPRPVLHASPQLLRLALDNLIDNAIKFSESGDTIRLSVRGEADSVAIEVRDEGCGIPTDEQERVFERFYQVERARWGAERGTGLGLSIVRNAVTAMNGSVTLESTAGVGTCVRLRLPQPTQSAASLAST